MWYHLIETFSIKAIIMNTQKITSLLLCLLVSYLGMLPMSKCDCADSDLRSTFSVVSNSYAQGSCVISEQTQHCAHCCPHASAHHAHSHHHNQPAHIPLPGRGCEKLSQIASDLSPAPAEETSPERKLLSLQAIEILQFIVKPDANLYATGKNYPPPKIFQNQSPLALHVLLTC